MADGQAATGSWAGGRAGSCSLSQHAQAEVEWLQPLAQQRQQVPRVQHAQQRKQQRQQQRVQQAQQQVGQLAAQRCSVAAASSTQLLLLSSSRSTTAAPQQQAAASRDTAAVRHRHLTHAALARFHATRSASARCCDAGQKCAEMTCYMTC